MSVEPLEGSYVLDPDQENIFWSDDEDAIYLENRTYRIESETFSLNTWTVEFYWNTRGQI